MAVATQKSAPGTNGAKPDKFDPDEYRMTLGEHLEELRGRLFLALGGYVILLIAAFFYGDVVVSYFCLPLVRALAANGVNTQLIVDEAGEGFMVFIQISMISAAAVGAPWIAYQIWQFIAAGLYPHERKYVNKFLPLSIALLIAGMLFVYFLILPWTLDFLVRFNGGFQIPGGLVDQEVAPVAVAATNNPKVPILKGNPKEAAEGDLWYDANLKRLKFFVNNQVNVISVQGNNLIATEIKLSTYIDLVITSLLIFGISFQLPIVVLAIERIGVVPIESLRSARQYVYFTLAIASAVITPGGDIPSMLGLTIPLIALYEFGIWLASLKPRTAAAA